jgi:glycosyltransferase involved in cell wall biosynthesis
MLDLPQWRGCLRDARILCTPTVIYFHENQWTYPISPEARTDFHFGYTNLLSALAADECWFNSAFHRDDFLTASRGFIQRMPDACAVHDFAALEQRCHVVPPGFLPVSGSRTDSHGRDSQTLNLGWVSRWEHDKRPDQFVELLKKLEQKGVDFRLILLGPRTRTTSELAEIRDLWSGRIWQDGFADTKQEYDDWLAQMDVVVSTADHEFFGIAVCEAIWAGAVPVLPNRLSYPELTVSDCLYNSLEEAAAMIEQLTDPRVREVRRNVSRQKVRSLQVENCVNLIDRGLQNLYDMLTPDRDLKYRDGS